MSVSAGIAVGPKSTKQVIRGASLGSCRGTARVRFFVQRLIAWREVAGIQWPMFTSGEGGGGDRRLGAILEMQVSIFLEGAGCSVFSSSTTGAGGTLSTVRWIAAEFRHAVALSARSACGCVLGPGEFGIPG